MHCYQNTERLIGRAVLVDIDFQHSFDLSRNDTFLRERITAEFFFKCSPKTVAKALPACQSHSHFPFTLKAERANLPGFALHKPIKLCGVSAQHDSIEPLKAQTCTHLRSC